MPSLNEIRKMATANPHGMGVATSGGLFIKTLNFDAFIEKIAQISTDENAIFHFRFATHGSVCRQNCHPFFDKKTGVYFMHNGVLPIESINNKTDSEMAFRQILVPKIEKYGLFSDEHIHCAVQLAAGRNRFAFLQGDELLTIGRFYERNGLLFSNLNFENYYFS